MCGQGDANVMSTSVVAHTRNMKLVHPWWEEHEMVQPWKTAQQVSGNTGRPHLNHDFPSMDTYPEELGEGMWHIGIQDSELE